MADIISIILQVLCYVCIIFYAVMIYFSIRNIIIIKQRNGIKAALCQQYLLITLAILRIFAVIPWNYYIKK